MPQKPVLDDVILERLKHSPIFNLTEFTYSLGVSYAHTWLAVQRLKRERRVTVQRSVERGRPLRIVRIDE